MIARVDNTVMIKMNNLQRSHQFSFLLQVQLNWSKNVQEERDAPWQIMLPSMNPAYFLYIHLAIWLEVFIALYMHASLTPFLFGFSTDFCDPEGGQLSKAITSKILRGKILCERNQQVAALLAMDQ